MAAKYTEITLEEMETFLRRAYRALRPKRGVSRGEVYYDLNLGDNKVLVRVWSSIHEGRQTGAGVGQDAIRVTMITSGGKPLMGKSKIVKRTQGWKKSLQQRVEEYLELYESKDAYWKQKQEERDNEPPGENSAPKSRGPRISDNQLRFLYVINKTFSNNGLPAPFEFDEAKMREMTISEAKSLIGSALIELKKKGLSLPSRNASDEIEGDIVGDSEVEGVLEENIVSRVSQRYMDNL